MRKGYAHSRHLAVRSSIRWGFFLQVAGPVFESKDRGGEIQQRIRAILIAFGFRISSHLPFCFSDVPSYILNTKDLGELIDVICHSSNSIRYGR